MCFIFPEFVSLEPWFLKTGCAGEFEYLNWVFSQI